MMELDQEMFLGRVGGGEKEEWPKNVCSDGNM